MALATALLILLVAAPAAYGAQYTVGDSNGWNSGVDYTTWLSGKTFTVGDTLVFKYDSTHKVDVVKQAGYTGCSSSSSNLLKSHSDGDTTITLDTAGPAYYICPTPGHCSNGMKLMVTVVAAGTPASPPSSTTPPPPSSTTPSPPSSTTPSPPPTTDNGSPPPPPPPPEGSSASAISLNLLGVPLVLGALIAFMV